MELWVEEATNLAKILEENPDEEEDNVTLNIHALMQMARSITVLAQTYGINQLVNGSGTMFLEEMVSSTVLLTSWHNVNIGIYLLADLKNQPIGWSCVTHFAILRLYQRSATIWFFPYYLPFCNIQLFMR